MVGDSKRVVLFSGRFDRPHLGHVISLQRLGRMFDKVIVVILDYPEAEYSIGYRRQLLSDALGNSIGNFDVTSNKTHFARVSKGELSVYGPFVYASGNHECLSHLASLGFETLYVERAYDFAASNDKRLQRIQRVLEA